MPEITLIEMEFDAEREEIKVTFLLENSSILEALRGEPRSLVSAQVFVPFDPEDALQTNAIRKAYELLLEHLQVFAQEIREFLQT